MDAASARMLVIGGSGFVGRHLKSSEARYTSLYTYYSNPFTDGVYYDLRSDVLPTLIRDNDITHVLFLGGIVKFSALTENPDKARYINVECTNKRISEVISSGAVPVYVSSESVFSGDKGNYTELETPTPICEYGAQKVCVEKHIRDSAEEHLILRFSKVFSSDNQPRSIVTSWISQLVENENINVATDNIFCPIHVKDVTKNIEALICGSNSGTYHLCSPKAYTRAEMLAVVMESYSKHRAYSGEINRTRLHEIAGAEGLPLNTSMSCEKVEDVTGYRASDFSYWARDIVEGYFNR